MCNYIDGIATSGSYFIYNGVRYGNGTRVLFTEDFYKRNGIYVDPVRSSYINTVVGFQNHYMKVFRSIECEYGKEVWKMEQNRACLPQTERYTDIDPDKDIEKIVNPVWYYTPRELVRLRIDSGVWFLYVWKQTLVYVLCLLISPIFQEWYLIWTIGLYAYLRLCYIALSKGGLNRGW